MHNIRAASMRQLDRYCGRTMLLLLSAVLFFGLFFAFQANAATYYVDATSGSDSNAGTSSGSAWKTVSKVNSSSFSAGDSILFKAGEQWREQLTIPSSGSSGSNITFGKYDTGNNPIINGADVITGWEQYPNLTAGLEGYWKLDETSGTRYDAHGSNDLTDNNTVTYDTGIISNAGKFQSSSSEYLSHSDNASLSLGSNSSFTLTAWVKVTSPTSKTVQIVGKRPNSENGVEYSLQLSSANPPVPVFEVANGSSKGTVYNASDTISTSDWNFIVAWHDEAANTINVQLNNGPIRSTSWIGGTQNGTSDLTIGKKCPGCSYYFNGLIDEVGFWKDRVLTADERALLYNGRTAYAYPFTVSSNIWEAEVTVEPNQVFFDNSRGIPETSTTTLDVANEWYWVGGELYVYATSDPDTIYTSPGIEASVRDRGILASSKDYVVIDGIDATKANGEGNIVLITSTDNITVKNLTVSYSQDNGIIFTGNDVLIQNIRATNNGRGFGTGDPHGHGIYAGLSGGYAATDWVVEYSELDNNARAGFHTYLCDGGVVRYNTAHDNGEWGIIIDNINVGADVDVYYNLAYDNTGDGIEVSYIGAGSVINVFNNVSYNNTLKGIKLAYNDSASSNSIVVKNNIFAENGEEDFYESGVTSKYIVKNDLFYRSDGNDTLYLNGTTFTLSELQNYLSSSGNPDNHVADDPDFSSPGSGNFHLQSTSPAIDAGVDVGLTEDYDGTSVPQNSIPDIGAFEYY